MTIKTVKRQAFEAGLDPRTLEPFTYADGTVLSVSGFLAYRNWTGLTVSELYDAGRIDMGNIRSWIRELYPAQVLTDMDVQDRFFMSVNYALTLREEG